VSACVPVEVRTILEQLGGQRIFAMAFAGCVYSAGEDRAPSAGIAGVALEIARPLRRAARGAAKVIVNLMGDDTYAVKLWKAPTATESQSGRHEGRYLEQLEGVHAAELASTVERVTGLRLSL
jgi:hypothetical protein